MPPQQPGREATFEEIVTALAKREGVDPRVALSFAEIESSLNPNTPDSASGAIGPFQLMPETAARHKVNPRVLHENILGGLREIKQLRDTYGTDLDLIARRYNASPQAPREVTDPYVAKFRTALQRRLRPTAAGTPPPASGGPPPPPPASVSPTTPPAPAAPRRGPLGFEISPEEQANYDRIMNLGRGWREFAPEALASLNPVTLARSLKQLFTTDPRETVKGLYQAHAEPFKQGYYEAAVPLLGPRLAEAHQFAEVGEYAKAAGAVADVGLQVFGPKLIGRSGRVRVAPRAFTPRLSPEEAAAVTLGQQAGVPVDVATASGSPFALKLQRAAEATPSGSPYGEAARLARGEQMPQLGERLASRVHPSPVTPEQAGRGLRAGVEDYIAQRHGEANVAYDRLRQIEASPRFTTTVQTGTRQVNTGVLDASGNPIVRTVPITETMQLPVDLRTAKTALRPLYDRLRRQLPITQQEASPGLRALQNILDGPDYMPASMVDVDLGTIKSLARGADLPQLRDVSQGLAAKGVQALSDAVDATIAQAGPRAQRALEAGRTATHAKHAAAEVFNKLREEPVGTFRQATRAKDSGIEHLRDLGRLAPQELSKVGRAVLEDLFSTATAEGGWSRATGVLRQWEKLGPETRKLLFGPAAADLDKFFLLGKMLERTPNPSGTALTLTGVGSGWAAIRHPLTGGPALISAGQIAKRMNDAKWVRFLTEGYTIPAGTPRAAAWTTTLLKTLGEEAAVPLDQPPPAPPSRTRQVATPPPAPPARTGGITIEGLEVR